MLRQIGVGGDSLSRTIHNNVEPIDLIFDRGMFFIMILKVHMFIPTLGLSDFHCTIIVAKKIHNSDIIVISM